MDDHSKCKHLHGHTAKAALHLKRDQLDERGMVMHFSELKQSFGKWIDEEVDHVMLLNEKDPLVAVLKAQGEKCKLLPFHPTAENIAKWFFEQAKNFGLPIVQLDIWESESSLASYAE